MGIYRANLNRLSDLADWLTDNGIATKLGVTAVYANSTLTITDGQSHTLAEITANTIKAYEAAGSYSQETHSLSYFNGTISAIGCDNGFMIEATASNARATLLAAKTNNEKVAFVFRIPGTTTIADAYRNAVKHVAWGDSTTNKTTTTFTPESGQQTIMTTFATNADITQVSYTPKAFYMPMHSAYNQGIGKFLCGGKVYITNGYWCIDTETYEEDAT